MSNKFHSDSPGSMLQSVANITELRDRDKMEKALLITLAELMPVKRITIYRIVPGSDGEEALIVAEVNANAQMVQSRLGLTAPLAKQRELLTMLASSKEQTLPLHGPNLFQSLYPISSKHGIVAFLEVISDKPTVEQQLVILGCLRIYRNYMCLLLESETDTLTGLLNRRTFDSNIENIIAEHSAPDNLEGSKKKLNFAQRKVDIDSFHWLAIMDIDHFKRVNDSFGHLYGDEVLILLAQKMRQVFRKQDRLFRFGGEEFVVVLGRTSLQHAQEVLERFRKIVENNHFPQIGKVTISIGFVCMAKMEVPSVLIGQADQALYFAKHNGRNQVCHFEKLAAEGKLARLNFSNDMTLF